MTALDDRHRQQLSPLAKARLKEFQAVKKSALRSEAQFELAFRRFVATLNPAQVQTLSRLLTELNHDRALH